MCRKECQGFSKEMLFLFSKKYSALPVVLIRQALNHLIEAVHQTPVGLYVYIEHIIGILHHLQWINFDLKTHTKTYHKPYTAVQRQCNKL